VNYGNYYPNFEEKNMTTKIDTSEELLIKPIHGGVKLIRPNKKIHEVNSLISVKKIMEYPINIYFEDCDSVIRNINAATVITAGYPSIKGAIGKTVRIAAKRETADQSMEDDKKVLKSKQIQICEENFVRQIDDFYFSAISFKFPLYNDKTDKIIGIFGYSIILGKNSLSLADSLSLMSKYGLLSVQGEKSIDYLAGGEINGVYLSNQELKCLRLFIRGMTTKIIGKNSRLSPRTVEHYIDNIKLKLDAQSKKDLIDKVFHHF